ncbi:hypothetical protein GCM10018781_32490 [Kitasatospora indigofera]|uniref:DUF2637 domain-containing protein n=1 Tax=Kitasatospora indigofera TaxID=67307 RepID=A0A919FSR0_9ACTN|nr:DUF2637 domain-containing protein [Kitasatospora indigofera]GHH71343.1 hypothetical protein GCM10018781_32490 [Kitasatospora indigofera]
MSRAARFWIVAALLAVVGMAFRVSWNALKDVAGAIGADPTAATVYPLVVDGLMALALVAVLVLTGADRRFALRVLVGYTIASLVLNYVHGLVPTLHGPGRMRLAEWAPAHWALVLLASSLPVGSIYFGSDLVAKVLHHKPEPAENTQNMANRSGSDLPGSADPDQIESVYESADPLPLADPIPAPAGPTPARPVRAVAALSDRPRRATGSVPKSARTKVPARTVEELLAEARSVTAGWPDAELNADRIRTTLRTSPARARVLRDALKAERLDAARPDLHAVPDAAPVEGEAPAEQAS